MTERILGSATFVPKGSDPGLEEGGARFKPAGKLCIYVAVPGGQQAGARLLKEEAATEERVKKAFEEFSKAVPGLINVNVSKKTALISREGGGVAALDLAALSLEKPEVEAAFSVFLKVMNETYKGSTSSWAEAGKKSMGGVSTAPMAFSTSFWNQGPMKGALQRLNEEFSSVAEVEGLVLELCGEEGAERAKKRFSVLTAVVDEKIAPHLADIQKRLFAVEEKLKIKGLSEKERTGAQSLKTNLTEHKRQLSVSRLNLYLAGAFAPEFTDKMDDLEKVGLVKEAANRLQETFGYYIADRYKGLFRSGEKILEDCKAYCVDVGALIFSALPSGIAREGVHQFWASHKVEAKKESIEDEIIRSVLGGHEEIPSVDCYIAQCQAVDEKRLKSGSKEPFEDTKASIKK